MVGGQIFRFCTRTGRHVVGMAGSDEKIVEEMVLLVFSVFWDFGAFFVIVLWVLYMLVSVGVRIFENLQSQ